MEYPLVPTRKHIEEENSAEVASLADSEKNPDDLTDSTTAPAPSLVGKILDVNPCTACYGTSSTSTTTTEQIDSHVQICCGGCDRGLNESDIYAGEIKVYFNDDKLNASELGEKEEKFYCYECAQINQGRTKHENTLKLVMDELLMYFVTMMEKKESQSAEKEAKCVDLERSRRGFGKMKKTLKNAFSFKKSNRHSHKQGLKESIKGSEENTKAVKMVEEDDEERTEKTEEFFGEKGNIQTVFSSPSSLHYRFDFDGNEHAPPNAIKKRRKSAIKKAFSKGKKLLYTLEKKKDKEDCTRVKAVAVVW